jgi:hypothetical protein
MLDYLSWPSNIGGIRRSDVPNCGGTSVGKIISVLYGKNKPPAKLSHPQSLHRLPRSSNTGILQVVGVLTSAYIKIAKKYKILGFGINNITNKGEKITPSTDYCCLEM